MLTLTGIASQTAPLLPLQQISTGTPTARSCGIIDASFNTSTDASWSGNLSLYAGDWTSGNTGQRLGVQIQSNGSAALLGLFGHARCAARGRRRRCNQLHCGQRHGRHLDLDVDWCNWFVNLHDR